MVTKVSMKARESIAGIELYYLTRELEQLIGRRIKKVYQLGRDVFSLTIWPELNGRRELILAIRNCVLLSKREWPKPLYPSALAMGLRKRLANAKIVDIRQPDMERLLILDFEGAYSGKLIVELFGRGNLILTDENWKILQVARGIKVKDRVLRRHETYKPPPKPETPSLLEIDAEKSLPIMERCSHLELWRFLVEIGIGPPYIDEILLKSKLRANMKIGDLTEDQKISFSKGIVWLKKRLGGEPEPVIYLSEGKMVNFSVFPLNSLSIRYEPRSMGSLLELLEEYFFPILSDRIKDKAVLELEKRVKALETQLQRQRDLLERYEEEFVELKRKGDLLFSHLYEVQFLIERARKGLQSNEILNVDRSKHIATIIIENTPIDVDFTKTASENASRYYNQAKKLSLKINRGKEMLKTLESKLSVMKGEVEVLQISRRPKIRRKRKWFERFRWFFSTEGFLVIGGKDRATNKELVRRYMEMDDLFFHIEQPGGAVVLVKTRGRVVGNETLTQAADYAASFSRAWREGLSYADVYYVRGEQVLSHPPPGMYIPKGSFYIKGKRTYLKGRLELAIGLWELDGELRITSCPVEASNRMKVKVRVVPGDMEKLGTAKMIKKILENELKKVTNMSLYLDLDEILKALPPGRFRIMRR